MIEARVFCSTFPGPHLLMLGGVHGDEPCGTVALNRLAGELAEGALTLGRGRVTLVPQANPQAAQAGTRYKDVNLNRVIRVHEDPHQYEHRIANTICSYIHGVDAVLDLHAVTAASPPFSFLEIDTPQVRGWLQALGLPYVLTNWARLYPGDSGSSAALYCSARGQPALAVECGQKTDPVSAETAYRMARLTLAHFGLAPPLSGHQPQPSRYLRMTEVVWKEREGQLLQSFSNFEGVAAGQPLARYMDGTVLSAPVAGVIIMPKATAVVGEEWYYLAEPAAA